jgi:hypothetical protein
MPGPRKITPSSIRNRGNTLKSGWRTGEEGKTAAAIERVNILDLTPWGKNPRLHSPKQIRQLARGIEKLGFINPVVIDADNRILAGHGRVAAARLLGLQSVPCLRVENMTPAQKRAYRRQQASAQCLLGRPDPRGGTPGPHQPGSRVRH